jgi:hypothetical protein
MTRCGHPWRHWKESTPEHPRGLGCSLHYCNTSKSHFENYGKFSKDFELEYSLSKLLKSHLLNKCSIIKIQLKGFLYKLSFDEVDKYCIRINVRASFNRDYTIKNIFSQNNYVEHHVQK